MRSPPPDVVGSPLSEGALWVASLPKVGKREPVRGRGLVGIVGENKLCMRKKFSLKNIVICAQIFFCKVVVFVYGAKGVHVL